MDRVRYEFLDVGQCSVTDEVLSSIEDAMDLEERKELDRKIRDFFECRYWSSLEQKLCAIHFFKIGYIAAHINYIKKEA